jgi:hypothetical protein
MIWTKSAFFFNQQGTVEKILAWYTSMTFYSLHGLEKCVLNKGQYAYSLKFGNVPSEMSLGHWLLFVNLGI